MADILSGPRDLEDAKLKATDFISSLEGMAHKASFSSKDIERNDIQEIDMMAWIGMSGSEKIFVVIDETITNQVAS